MFIDIYIYIMYMFSWCIMRPPALNSASFPQAQLQQELEGEKQLHSQTRGQLEESQLQIQAPAPEKWRVMTNSLPWKIP